MNLNSLSNSYGARRPRKRVGRGMGSGTGKTCGAGGKGQMGRKGHKRKLGFEGGQMRLIRRIPKRGFISHSDSEFTVVNVGDLADFEAGTEVTAEILKTNGLIKKDHGRVKLLGDGEIKNKLAVKLHCFSSSAKRKVEAAGGSCEVVGS